MFRVLSNELKRLTQNRFTILAIIIITLMPLVYSFLYLYAFWDPYAKLDKLPIAVVNQDKETMYNGEKVNYGNNIVKELKKTNDFKWNFVSYSNGIDGLKGNKYYFLILIPDNFTKDILSVNGNEVNRAHIKYITNDKKNFLATQLGNKAMADITSNISATIRKGYLNTISVNIDKMGNGFKAASDGEKKLTDGTLKINDGMNKLNIGIVSAFDGSNQLKAGILSLNNATISAANGASNLYNGSSLLQQNLDLINAKNGLLINGISNMNKGLNGVNNGLVTIKQSIDELQNGSKEISYGYNQIDDKIKTLSNNMVSMDKGLNNIGSALNGAQSALQLYAKENPNAMNDVYFANAYNAILNSNAGLSQINTELNNSMPDINKLDNSIGQLNNASENIQSGLDELSNGVSKLQGISSQLVNGGNSLNSGILEYTNGISLIDQKMKDISNGLEKLNLGLNSLKNGSTELYNGTIKLNGGLGTVATGSSSLKDGIQNITYNQKLLSSKLEDASNKIDVSSINDNKSDMINKPIVLDTRRINPVVNYGIGFTPYFIPLSLWVGSLILFFIVDLFDRDGYKKEKSVSIIMGKFISISILAVLQSIVSSFILIEALKLPVNHLFYYYLINALMSVVFSAIIGLFILLFGMAGRFLAIVLLMLQLTSSGGTFPMELVPKFFNIINPYLPMTYGTQALREAISGGSTGYLLNDIEILVGFGVVFLLLSILLAEKIGDTNKLDEKLSL